MGLGHKAPSSWFPMSIPEGTTGRHTGEVAEKGQESGEYPGLGWLGEMEAR